MEDSERRKVSELLKEMRNNVDELKSTSQEGGLKWMYKGPSDLIDREEYLLGKAIDKTFEELNSGGSTDLVGRTGEQSNVPKRILEKTDDNIEQVDIAKKILEDPLYAIKQKEMEARKKLLNNPVKLKQIKQMLLERSKQNNAHRKEKKRKLKKNSEEHLNLQLIKKLKKFSDKEKRKVVKKIMKQESESSSCSSSSDSSSSSSSDDRKKHKFSRKRKRSSSSDSTESSTDSRSLEDYKKNSKAKRRKNYVEKRKKESSSSSGSSDSEIEKKQNSKKHKRKKTNYSEKDSSIDSDSKRVRKPKHKRRDFENEQMSSEKDHGQRNKHSRSGDSKDNKQKKNYGLMMPDGKKPEMKRRSPVRKFERKVEAKSKYVPPPQSKPLSEKEREKMLREMMKDAKLRKEEREKNLANHRRKELQEEKSKSYDDDFMRRQIKHFTSEGTMADRIKSNINNIQRSKSSMDSSFMRK